MAYLLYLCAVFILRETSGQVMSSCPVEWVGYGEHCYHISRETEEWISALDMCKLRESNLLQIETEEESRFITQFLKNTSSGYTDEEFWIALSDWDKEGTFVWEPEGLSLSYANWAPGQPDNYANNQHCTILYTREHYQWADRPCHTQYSYICEKEKTFHVDFGK